MSSVPSRPVEQRTARLDDARPASDLSLNCRRYDDGTVSVHLPRRGFGSRTGAICYFAFGSICLLLGLVALFYLFGDLPQKDIRTFGGVLLIFALIFGTAWYHGLRRRYTRFDAVASPHALLVRTVGFGKTRSRCWSRAEIACVRVRPVKQHAHDDPGTTALLVVTAAGSVVSFLANHDEPELQTIATELNRVLASDPIEAEDFVTVDDESPSPPSGVRRRRTATELRIELLPLADSPGLRVGKAQVTWLLMAACFCFAIALIADGSGRYGAAGLGGFCTLGALLVGCGLIAWRWQRGTIEATPETLRITERVLLWRKSREWPRGKLRAIRAGASSVSEGGRPMLELQVVAVDSQFGHFVGRDRRELNWAATELRKFFDITAEPEGFDRS